MSTIGITCPPIPGHLNPMYALAKELKRRGHRPIILTIADAAEATRKQGIEVGIMAESEYPLGVSQTQIARVARLGLFSSLQLTMQLCREYTEMQFRELPPLARSLGIDGMIVDEACWAGASVAQHLDVPYVSLANGLAFSRDTGMPPMYTGWQPAHNLFGRLRNWLCFKAENLLVHKLSRRIHDQRQRWSLSAFDIDVGVYSKLAHLSQLPECFDYPKTVPEIWHGVGPIRSPETSAFPFPYERLDGRPLIYASLGTLQGGRRDIFAVLAEAAAPLDAQLVITHGNQLTEQQEQGFAGDPLVVRYAPQEGLLERAALAVTHAGTNTVLDIIGAGVPALAIPLAYEQPSIAARVAWHGVGAAIAPDKLSVTRVREALKRLLGDPSYRSNARQLGAQIRASGGVQRAAHVVDLALRTGQPVLSSGWHPVPEPLAAVVSAAE